MEKSLQSVKPSFFNNFKPPSKELILSLIGIAAIVGFFMLPPYHEWMNERIIAYYHDFTWQKNKMGMTQRMADRFEGDYTYSKQIAAFFDKKKSKQNVLVLVPPTDYFDQHDIEYHVPEPIVFYYYTGLKTVWPNSSNANQANWYVRVNNGKIVVDSIINRQSFADTLTALKKFNISL